MMYVNWVTVSVNWVSVSVNWVSLLLVSVTVIRGHEGSSTQMSWYEARKAHVGGIVPESYYPH